MLVAQANLIEPMSARGSSEVSRMCLGEQNTMKGQAFACSCLIFLVAYRSWRPCPVCNDRMHGAGAFFQKWGRACPGLSRPSPALALLHGLIVMVPS
jgi:hypothetical protein